VSASRLLRKNKMESNKEALLQKDEATTFILASCMVTTYHALLTKDAKGIATMMRLVGEMFKQDPGFLKRFKAAEKMVMDTYNAHAESSNPPPSLL
jgi:uncharacterized protein (UPF0297 family)